MLVVKRTGAGEERIWHEMLDCYELDELKYTNVKTVKAVVGDNAVREEVWGDVVEEGRSQTNKKGAVGRGSERRPAHAAFLCQRVWAFLGKKPYATFGEKRGGVVVRRESGADCREWSQEYVLRVRSRRLCICSRSTQGVALAVQSERC